MPVYNRVKAAVEGLIPAGASANPIAADFRRLFEKYGEMYNIATIAAGSTITEGIVFVAERPCIVTDAYFVGGAAITANDTNFSGYVAAKRTVGTPGTNVDFLTFNFKITAGTGNITAFLKTSVTSFFDTDQTKRTLAAGDVLTIKSTTAGTGLAIGAGSRLVLLVTELSD